MTPNQMPPLKIAPMTQAEFVRWCHDNNICREVGCYNRAARGYTFCEACLHGETERAEDGVIRSKRWHEKRLID